MKRNRKKQKRIVFWKVLAALAILICVFLCIIWFFFFKSEKEKTEMETTSEIQQTIEAETTVEEKGTKRQQEVQEETEVQKEEEEIPALAYREPAKMYVHFIDVGQGDATLFLIDDHAMLVDTGSGDSAAAASNRDIIKYLEELEIDYLDYLVLSHGHEDHVGRATDVMKACDVGQIIVDFGNSEGYVKQIMDMIEYRKLDILKPQGGEELKLGDANVQILTGRVGELPQSEEEITNVNNQSIGIRVTYGDMSFLMYGDGELAYENYLLQSGYKLKSDVLKVPHHGYESSLCDAILEKIHPKYAVISSAKQNNFGFPSDAILQKLGLAEVATFCTNRLGNIVAETDGKSILWSTNDEGH